MRTRIAVNFIITKILKYSKYIYESKKTQNLFKFLTIELYSKNVRKMLCYKLGNLLPNYSVLNPKTPRAEEAALELACQWNDIDTVVICGHSDCKVTINSKLILDRKKY